MVVGARRTRLLRVPDLPRFQRAIATAAIGADHWLARDTAVLVPTVSAADELRHTLETLLLIEGWRPSASECEAADAAVSTDDAAAGGGSSAAALVLPHLVTRAGFYQLIAARATGAPPLLDRVGREVLFERAAARAADRAAPPFEVRPALLSEMQLFYDALGRHARGIDDFERLVGGPLESGALIDRGAQRLLEQTRFLAATFREYERALAAAGAFDEHLLRAFVLEHPLSRPIRRVVVTVADQAASASGLFRTDYDLLTRLPGLESILVVATEAVLASGYLGRVLEALPEVDIRVVDAGESSPPVLLAPAEGPALYHTGRDREEELVHFARRAVPSSAFVYQRPLPYLSLARQVLDAYAVTWQAVDAQPLAAEPYSAALDLVLTAVTTDYARGPVLALLRAPQFRCAFGDAPPPTREELAACDRELREAYYFGGRDRLRELRDRWTTEPDDPARRGRGERASRGRERRRLALPAVESILALADRLQPLETAAPAAEHLRVLLACLRAIEAPPAGSSRERWLRARGAILVLLQELAAAFTRFGDAPRPFADVAALLRRLIEEHTFNPRVGPGAVHLVDAEAAPYGRFAHVTLAGVVEGEWPGGGGRDIFYPSGLLRDLGWSADADRRAAGRAAFDDLLRLPSVSVAVSTFALDDEAIVRPSPLVEDLEAAGLVVRRDGVDVGVAAGPLLALAALDTLAVTGADGGQASAWRAQRASRRALDDRFRGAAGPVGERPYAVTGLDRYLQCPFKFFAAQVLRLEEEPDDRPGLTVQERGQFVHDVFREFFSRWNDAGHGAIDAARIDAARTLFVAVVDDSLRRLPESERGVERARLIGSLAGAGLGERAFRFEAARPTPIVERFLELALDGTYALGEGEVRLRGTADRIDLLEDGTLRVLDYKTGKASSARDALQIPVYAYCAERRLAGHRGRSWTVGDAGYLAFGRPEPYVAVVTAADREPALAKAAATLGETIARIERGEFPVSPDEPHMCMYCGFASVCRKDYVEEE